MELVDVTAEFEQLPDLKQCSKDAWQGKKVGTWRSDNFYHAVLTPEDNIHSAFTQIRSGGAFSVMIVYADDEDYVKGWQCFLDATAGQLPKSATTVLEWPDGATKCYISSQYKDTMKLFRYEKVKR